MENEWTKEIEKLRKNNELMLQVLEAVNDWLDDPKVYIDQKDTMKKVIERTLEEIQ